MTRAEVEQKIAELENQLRQLPPGDSRRVVARGFLVELVNCCGLPSAFPGCLSGPRPNSGRSRTYPFATPCREPVTRLGLDVRVTCIEGDCDEPVLSRDDGLCYFHGKLWDGLMDLPPRRKRGR